MCCLRRLSVVHLRLVCLKLDKNGPKREYSRSAVLCSRYKQEKRIREVEEEFRTFKIPGLKTETGVKRTQRRKMPVPPPRYQQMPVDQDWTNVWPAATTFKWSAVPFPVRQGYVETVTENEGVIPSKYANAELMKIPNFLHLTPAHIKKHCAALREFCTEWPAGLETDQACQKHFPVEVETSDYCFSGPSIRDPRARTITVKVKLSDLDLDYHARDKFVRLVGDRFKPDTGEVIFTTDRCPMKKQNYDYAMYLLTAVYHESWKREPWEAEKTEEDMEKYFWDISKSRKTVVALLQNIGEIDKESAAPEEKKLQHLPEDTSEEKLIAHSEVVKYRDAVSDLRNGEESQEALERYGDGVRRLLNIQGSLS
ncbi:hypothetical protein BaRGS_00011545 [Batillaria attramentaria]|uniref:Small ribosomal subunit protein mS35 mitochondrial conserved domain-containing protein n=1 Tax=Batillaria attramentaria TaxID=370345 RepID=A0ABD0LDN0_9CAEN